MMPRDSLHIGILRAAALLAPAAERGEWLAEWRAELCYVDRGATAFCLGAFRDALWLRRNSAAPNGRHTFGLESPLKCLGLMALVAAVSVGFALRLSLPREMLLPGLGDAANLMVFSGAGNSEA